MSTIDIPLGVTDPPTITLRASGVRVLSTRFHIAQGLVKAASRVLRGRLALVEAEPPATTHVVSVDKVGVDMVLRVGDRAVRLDPKDAAYIGGLLSSRWVGGVYEARVYSDGSA